MTSDATNRSRITNSKSSLAPKNVLQNELLNSETTRTREGPENLLDFPRFYQGFGLGSVSS